MRRRILILLCCLPLFAQAQSVAPDGDYCGYSSAHRDLDSVCRTHADGGQYCEYDPYGRVCAYVTVLYNGEDRTYCMTCVDGSPTPPGGTGQPRNGYNYLDCGYYYGDWTGCTSPIVIDLNDGSYPLSGKTDPVVFDLDADGLPELATWTAPGSAVAFLALDRNGNGVIDSGNELFGNHTPGSGASTAANGFEALAVLDTNHDGRIDASDTAWVMLLLWTDRNHDGRSSPSELQPLASSPVTAILLDYRLVGRRDEYGNFFRYEGALQLSHGIRRIYDVFFRVAAP